MTKKKHAARVALKAAADALADEIWAGAWNHLKELHANPVGHQPKLVQELKRRCPGHTKEEYADALVRSWILRR